MQEECSTLVNLYHRRQELFKELNEIDSKIRAAEIRTSKRERLADRSVAMAVSNGDVPENSPSAVVMNAMVDQEGARKAQLMLEEACDIDYTMMHPEEIVARNGTRNAILRETFKRATELMIDPNGNYYMQRVISLLKPGGIDYATLEGTEEPTPDQSEVLVLLDSIGADLPEIACNMHGTRTVQRLIDVLTSCEEFELFSDLVANDLVMMIKDLNGNHAVLRLLLANNFVHLGESDSVEMQERGQSIRKDIYHIIATNCVDICVNRQGCCIIQRCLQSAPDPFRSEIVSVALNNVLALVQDPFGNYAIQYVLDLQNDTSSVHPNYTNKIIHQMLHHIGELSCNKFGSNVIEKCLKSASSDVRQLIIEELTDQRMISKLLTDSFANYVIQTAIMTASDDAQFHQLRDAILPLQHLLKNSPYGVKIEAKLQKRSRELMSRSQYTAAPLPPPPPPASGQFQHQGPPSYNQFTYAGQHSYPPTAAAPTYSESSRSWSQQAPGYTAVQSVAAPHYQSCHSPESYEYSHYNATAHF